MEPLRLADFRVRDSRPSRVMREEKTELRFVLRWTKLKSMAETLVPTQVTPLKVQGSWFGSQLLSTVWSGREALKLRSFWVSLEPPEATASGDRRQNKVMATRRESGEMAVVEWRFIVLFAGLRP
ncbi:hypothetical protein TorRG33x02_185040 [Trema orientale]|uniref:Uncharacterized protein n=1 Tax=Trema orientale TaxID=63057 RepID=A0A2P5EJC9_TREOI|nr:hypothetical protein TorRG33x02_185040 [Trema orientale]